MTIPLRLVSTFFGLMLQRVVSLARQLRAFPWFVCTVFPLSQERCNNSWSRAVVHSSLVDCAALLQSKEALGRHPLSTGYGTSASTSASKSASTSASTSMLTSTSPCTGHQHFTFLDSCFERPICIGIFNYFISVVTTKIGPIWVMRLDDTLGYDQLLG